MSEISRVHDGDPADLFNVYTCYFGFEVAMTSSCMPGDSTKQCKIILYHGCNILTNQIALLEVYKSLIHLL